MVVQHKLRSWKVTLFRYNLPHGMHNIFYVVARNKKSAITQAVRVSGYIKLEKWSEIKSLVNSAVVLEELE